MSSLFLALVATAAITLAGREAVRVARLSAALGASGALLAACWLACAVAAGLATWVGGRIAGWLGPDAEGVLVVAALLFAAGELALSRPGRAPAEPTRSLGAIVIVLGTAQSSSAASIVILALAARAEIPELAALGGVLGSGAVLTVAWRTGRAWEAGMSLRALRWMVVGLLLLGAALSARELLADDASPSGSLYPIGRDDADRDP